MNRRPPPMQTDASGECRHLYLTRNARQAEAEAQYAATCVHCGIQFRLAWQSSRPSLLWPMQRNLIIAIVGVVLMVASRLIGQALPESLFLVVAVLFFTRSALGGFELFLGRHGFVPGRLGPVYRRSPYNPFPPKRYITNLGVVRFPIDLETYRRFEEGDTLLFEHLRWSRLPVAIYKGYSE